MKVVRFRVLTLLCLAAIGVLLISVCSGNAFAQAENGLKAEDCVKCHAAPPADLEAAGGKHKGVGCLGCHVGHPPTVKKPIPQCSQCHGGKAHYELAGCLGCHKNPHTPLKISFAGNITEACLTCHTKQIAQLRENKSKHTALNCSTCHSVHGKIPQCTQCHKPHSSEVAAADCKQCHKAHMPKVVTYEADVPSKLCGSCHKEAFTLLTNSSAKHKSFACAFCHQGRHKAVPACQDCHGSPHPAGIMTKFTKCGECHNIAHNLNNWPAATTKEAPKEVQRRKK